MARWNQRLARQTFETTEEGAPGNMESVLPRGVVTFEPDTLGEPAYRDFGYIRRIGGQARRSSICTMVGLTLAPPKHTAILSGMLQRKPERGCLSRTIALLPNIHFRLCLFNLSPPLARQRACRLS